jgi:hypothetical protein
MTVVIAVDYLVKIGFIPVFHYRLRGSEFWQGNLLMSAQANTDDNGKAAWMRAERQGDSLLVQGSKSGTYRAPANVITASHWNQAEIEAPMINPQDGRLMQYSVVPKGPDRVTDSNGRVLPAQHFSLTGKDGLDLWYDTDGIWAGLQAKADDGSNISYVRLAL